MKEDEAGTAMSFGIPGFIVYTDNTMSEGTITFLIEGDTMG